MAFEEAVEYEVPVVEAPHPPAAVPFEEFNEVVVDGTFQLS